MKNRTQTSLSQQSYNQSWRSVKVLGRNREKDIQTARYTNQMPNARPKSEILLRSINSIWLSYSLPKMCSLKPFHDLRVCNTQFVQKYARNFRKLTHLTNPRFMFWDRCTFCGLEPDYRDGSYSTSHFSQGNQFILR